MGSPPIIQGAYVFAYGMRWYEGFLSYNLGGTAEELAFVPAYAGARAFFNKGGNSNEKKSTQTLFNRGANSKAMV